MSVYQNHWEFLLKHRLLGPTFRVSDFTGLGKNLRIFITNKIPGNADVIGWLGHSLRITAIVSGDTWDIVQFAL